jgi:membrane-bound serine protease (ClpP class)
MMLIKKAPGVEFMHISWLVILTTTAISALFFLVVLGFGLKAQRLKPVTGLQGLNGAIGECLMAIDPVGKGTVRVHGEVWNAITTTIPIRPGEKVRITGVKGLTLYVEPMG